MTRKLLLVAGVVLMAALAFAEVAGNNNVAITDTATNVTFQTYYAVVLFENPQASSSTIYIRLFCDSETVAAATTASPIVLERGVIKTYTHERTDCGRGYGGFSAITATGTTATLRWEAK